MYKNKLMIFLLFSLILTGCGTININQKLYRDGSFDLSIEIKSDNQMFINTFKEQFEQSPIAKKATLIEEQNGYKYVLKKIKFSEILTEEGNSIFDSIGVKKEFKFPYSHYTITIKNEGLEDAQYGSMGMGLNYIIEPFGKITDTNGIYIGENKKAVKFNLMKSNDYYVTFKDLFIFSWFGGAGLDEREVKKVKLSFDLDNRIQEKSQEKNKKNLIQDYVNDYADIINYEYKQELNYLLEKMKNSGKVEYAIVTINSLDGQDIESYAFEIANGKLGDKQKNNGLLLLVSLKDKQYRIDVGTGLEEVFDEDTLSNIGNKYLVPYFKSGEYGKGILEFSRAINQIINVESNK